MKSARTFSQEKKSSCHQHHDHQQGQKCQTGRNREISYNFFPKEKLNVSVNVHPKCMRLKYLNFETLAYEKYVKGKEPETQSERNFVKNFYLENIPEQMCMTNQIVKQCQEETYPFNSYNLAENATKDYYAFQFKRKQYLLAAQKRAKINSNLFIKELKEQSLKNFEEKSKWIQKIMGTLQDLGERMFNLATSNKQNQEQNGKQRIFLNEKSYANPKYLKEYKIQDPQTSKKIFQDLRANMLRKKNKFEDEKIKNRKSDLTVSQISESGNQSNTISQSMISAVSEAEKQNNQEQIINELCDFDKLKKKWKTLDVERIKDLILSTLTRKIITNCEGQRAKIISTYKDQCKSIPSKLQGKKTQDQGRKKRPNTLSKNSEKAETKLAYKNDLSKQQLETKDQLIRSDQFGSVGQKYEKTRNYSNLFKKKEQAMRLDFSLMESLGKGNKINFFQENGQRSEKNEYFMKGYQTTRANSLRM